MEERERARPAGSIARGTPRAASPDVARTLACYLAGRGVPAGSTDGDLERERTVSAWLRAGPFVDQPAFADPPHARGRLAINPLFEVRQDGDGALLERRLPSAAYAEENPELEAYLPATFRLDAAQLASLRDGSPRGLEAALERMVVIGTPA